MTARSMFRLATCALALISWSSMASTASAQNVPAQPAPAQPAPAQPAPAQPAPPAAAPAATTAAPAATPAPAPAPAPTAAPAATPAPAPTPTPAPAAMPAPAPAPTMAEPAAEPVAEPPAEESPPEEEEEAADEPAPISVAAWMHAALLLHNYEKPKKLNDISHDNEIDLLVNGEISDHVGLTADLVATYGPSPVLDDDGTVVGVSGDIEGSAAVLDLIGRFKVVDEFNVWVGRMLVPSDRSNFSGFWFASPWYYPGFYQDFAPPIGPRQGPHGRNDGLTVWGDILGGLFKYYWSAFNLHDPSSNPLISGRLNLALLNGEPGYYHSSTYYGSKDILAIGIAGQSQKDSSVSDDPDEDPDDYGEFNADILFEKTLGSAGVLTLEGAFYKYFGDFEANDYSYFLVASYLTPSKIGWGKLQPLFRLQQAQPTADEADPWTMIDAQLGYVVNDYATRFALGYQHKDVNGLESNGIYLGVQLQK